jgi:predicted component of type VI protein secretion system
MAAGRLWTVLGIAEPGKPSRVIIWDTAEISVGRAPENDVVVDDTDASRQHALFRRSSAGFQVMDLGTSNGTLVNDVRIGEAHTLASKDVVKVCEMQIRFVETRKDPSTLGLEVAYASQLKGFSGGMAPNADPSATTIGLGDPVSGPFEIGAVGDFAPVAQSAPRDLDLEFAQFEPRAGGAPATKAATVAGTVSLQLEIEGLTPDLARIVEALFGKTIELPAMRVRVKSGDGL